MGHRIKKIRLDDAQYRFQKIAVPFERGDLFGNLLAG